MIEKKVKNRINLEELSEQLQISYVKKFIFSFGKELLVFFALLLNKLLRLF